MIFFLIIPHPQVNIECLESIPYLSTGFIRAQKIIVLKTKVKEMQLEKSALYQEMETLKREAMAMKEDLKEELAKNQEVFEEEAKTKSEMAREIENLKREVERVTAEKTGIEYEMFGYVTRLNTIDATLKALTNPGK